MKRETKIGLLALITIVVIAIGFQFLKGKSLFSTTATYYVVYENVAELAKGDMVVINGYKIGQVSGIELNMDNVRSLIVSVEVDNSLPIPKTAGALIKSDGLLGGKFISLEFDEACSGDNCAQSGDYLQAAEESIISGLIGDPASLEPYIDLVKDNAGPLLDSITSRTDTNGIGRTMQNLEATSQNLASLTAKLDRLLLTSSANLSATTKHVAGITKNLEENNYRIASILASVDTTTAKLSMLNLEHTLTQVNETLQGLRSTLDTSQQAMGNIAAITESIEKGEGSLGKLIGEDDIYTRLDRTVTNLDLLLQDFRLNPKRYVNVSVFGKKQKEYTYPDEDPAEKDLPTDSGN